MLATPVVVSDNTGDSRKTAHTSPQGHTPIVPLRSEDKRLLPDIGDATSNQRTLEGQSASIEDDRSIDLILLSRPLL